MASSGGGGWSAGQEVAVLSDWEKYEAFINEVQGAKAVLFFKQSDERSSVMQKALAALQRGQRRLCGLLGAEAPLVFKLIRELAASTSENEAIQTTKKFLPEAETEEQLRKRLEALVSRHDVMIFMKGERAAPFCRFSKALMQLLKEQGVCNFDTFDVFSDNSVREGMKRFSDWPTFPQIYVQGKFIGGLDILTEMARNGSLKSAFPPSAFEPSLSPA